MVIFEYDKFAFADYMQDICPQIEDTEVSDRWEFPSKFYAESFTNLHGNLTVDIIMIDTGEHPYRSSMDFVPSILTYLSDLSCIIP